MARPTIFNEALAEEICRRLAMGEPLAKICLDDEMPAYSTARKWEAENPVFSALSASAKLDGTHYMADECIEIADGNGDPADKRIRIDTRLRLIGKWNRKAYGDTQTLKHTGADGGPVQFANMTEAEIDARLAAALAGSAEPHAPASEDGGAGAS